MSLTIDGNENRLNGSELESRLKGSELEGERDVVVAGVAIILVAFEGELSTRIRTKSFENQNFLPSFQFSLQAVKHYGTLA